MKAYDKVTENNRKINQAKIHPVQYKHIIAKNKGNLKKVL